MSNLKISIAAKVPTFKKGTAFVIGVKETSKGLQLTKSHTDISSLAKHDLDQLGASSSLEAVTRVAAPSGAIFAIVGLGSEKAGSEKSAKDKLSADQLRAIGGAIARSMKNVAQLQTLN